MPTNLPNYEDLGYNQWMERSIGTTTSAASSPMSELNFDQVQMSGSLGDKIQIGGENILIDGTNKRIIITDGKTERIVIGEL
jgi:hypothetical protein